MILFRHISARERWGRYRPGGSGVFALLFLAIACLVALDSVTGRWVPQALEQTRLELALAACVERLARPGDSGTRRQRLRNECAARQRGEP